MYKVVNNSKMFLLQMDFILNEGFVLLYSRSNRLPGEPTEREKHFWEAIRQNMKGELKLTGVWLQKSYYLFFWVKNKDSKVNFELLCYFS